MPDVYYRHYAQYGTRIVVLSYVADCVYWYKSEALVNFVVETQGKRFYVNFQGFSHWFMSISISQLKDHYISVDQDRYATSDVAKYLYTVTVNGSKKFYKTTFTPAMIFTKYDASTSAEQVKKLCRGFNI